MNASNAFTTDALSGMKNESVQWLWQGQLRIDDKVLFSFLFGKNSLQYNRFQKIRSLIEGGCLFSLFFHVGQGERQSRVAKGKARFEWILID